MELLAFNDQVALKNTYLYCTVKCIVNLKIKIICFLLPCAIQL